MKLNNFNKDPHLLVCGSSGGGKTTFLKTLINENIEEFDILLWDPKRIDYQEFESGFIAPIGYEISHLRDFISFLNDRMQEILNGDSNEQKHLLVIEEYSSVVLQDKKLEKEIIRLAQIGRSFNIFLILVVQNPSYEILNSNIKANISNIVCVKVANRNMSYVALGVGGAQELKQGEYYYKNNDNVVKMEFSPLKKVNITKEKEKKVKLSNNDLERIKYVNFENKW